MRKSLEETTCGGNLACSCEPFLRTQLRSSTVVHSLSFALKKLTLTSRYYRRSRSDISSACPLVARRSAHARFACAKQSRTCRTSRTCERRTPSGDTNASFPRFPQNGGNIAPLSGDFAREKRGECTTVLDPSGERRKVRGSKRDCRRYMMPAFSAATLTDQKSLVKMVSIPALKRSATSAGSSQ